MKPLIDFESVVDHERASDSAAMAAEGKSAAVDKSFDALSSTIARIYSNVAHMD